MVKRSGLSIAAGARRRKRNVPLGRPVGRTGANSIRGTILECAAELFSELGYEGTSLKAIADKVGITAPALYNHFGKKRDILFACFENALSSMVARAKEAVSKSDDDPVSKLYSFTFENARFQLENASLQSVYQLTLYNGKKRILTPGQSISIKKLQRQHLDNLKAILKEGQSANEFDCSDINVTAFSIFALAEHLPFWVKKTGPRASESICSEIAQLSLRLVGVTE